MFKIKLFLYYIYILYAPYPYNGTVGNTFWSSSC